MPNVGTYYNICDVKQRKKSYFPVFRAHLQKKLNYPKNQAFACEKLANMGVPR